MVLKKKKKSSNYTGLYKLSLKSSALTWIGHSEPGRVDDDTGPPVSPRAVTPFVFVSRKYVSDRQHEAYQPRYGDGQHHLAGTQQIKVCGKMGVMRILIITNGNVVSWHPY